MALSLRRSAAGSVVLPALVAAALVGCGSSGDASVTSKKSSSGTAATTLAPATGPELDLTAAKAALEQLKAFDGDMIVTETNGVDKLGVSSACITVDMTHGRVRVENHETEVSPTAHTSISEANDLYVWRGNQWTKLTLDPSLLESAPGKSQFTSMVDLIEKTGAELRQDGTIDANGETWKKYRASVDGDTLWTTFTSNSALSQLGSEMPTLSDMVGKVSGEVDETNLIRRMWLALSFLADGDPGSLEMTMTRNPLAADSTVDLPPADQIIEAKSVTTAEELGAAMQAAIS